MTAVLSGSNQRRSRADLIPVALVLVQTVFAIPAAAQVTLRMREPLQASIQIKQPIASTATADGGLVILDGQSRSVIRLDSRGMEQWRTGGDGSNLGQFRLPSRLSQYTAHGFLVYDAPTKTVTYMTASGKAERRWSSPLNFRIVDAIAELPNGDVAISGFAESRSAHAVHIISAEGIYQHSTAPVPQVREDWVLQYWGVGPIVLGADSDLYFVRRLPYEVYDVKGDVARLLTKHELGKKDMPDDAYYQVVQGDSFRLGHSNTIVPKVGKLYTIGGGILVVARLMGTTLEYDVFESRQYACTVSLPSSLGSIAGITTDGSVTWTQVIDSVGVHYVRTSTNWREACRRG